jgi:hypothetical protein
MHPEVQGHSSDHIIDIQTELSIRAGLDGFSFYATRESGEIVFYKKFEFLIEKENLLIRKFSELLHEPLLTGYRFNTVTVYFSGKEFNLIPELFFSEKLKKFPLSVKYHSGDERESFQLQLPGIGANLVYYVPAKLTAFFSTAFPGCRFSHEIIPVLQYAGTRKDSFMILLLHASWFTCAVIEEGLLSLISTFRYHHDNDLLFFILSLTNHFSMEDKPVLVSGRDHRFDEKFRLIRNYLAEATEFGFFPCQEPNSPVTNRSIH